ncbi:MAG: rhomboid family intramembrane serine protease [Prevotellaceae bacterium]|jgi:membrane associated rhomboid family serine protease|nr:rhomboid family intramembrane serine protease [Prevotellaceae bacterium]
MNRQTASPFSQISTVVLHLIIINTLVWLATVILYQRFDIDLADYLGLHSWNSATFNPAQLLTYMFMHQAISADGSMAFGHLFFNMFSLYMFGRILEQVWGWKKFLFYYLFAGLGAAVMQEITWMITLREVIAHPDILCQVGSMQMSAEELLGMLCTVGASGSVFGILLAFGWLFPEERLMLIFLPIPIKARLFVGGYAIIELFLGVANFRFDNIAHFAHLGGMVFGALLLLYWKKKGKLYRRN